MNLSKRGDPRLVILESFANATDRLIENYDLLAHRDLNGLKESGIDILEADYCVLIGFFQGKTGFPNENQEEAVVEALLPSLDTFPHSEERRLLYVGITRAKKKSYLIADPMATSEFIVELLSPKYGLHIASSTFKEQYRRMFKCPICSTGHFKMIKGKFGNFYSCTSGEICNAKPRVCKKCGTPSVDSEHASRCTNPQCANTIKICEKCGRPMKLKEGKYGQFWGCTGYGIKDDQCRNTTKIT
jgi:DNA helicase-4